MAMSQSPSIQLVDQTPSIKGSPPKIGKSPFYHVEKAMQSSLQELGTSPSTIQKVGAELVGTYLLILIGCGSAFINEHQHITIVGIAFAWGLAVMMLIYTVGHISGGHFNPAVTIAFAVTGKFPWINVPLYVVGQLLGSIMASVTLRWMFSDDRPELMLTLPASSVNDLVVVVWEIIASFILMFVISGAAADERATKELSGVAVGAAIFLDALMVGTITGASMNPARSIGPAIVASNLNKIWIYIFSPVIGTIGGSAIYQLLNFTRKPMKGATAEMGDYEKSMEIP